MNRREFVAGFSLATGTLTLSRPAMAAPWEANVVAAESFYHAALYYAIDNKLFENAGIKIARLWQGLPGKDVITGFASGSFDIAVTGCPPQGVFWGRGIPIKVVMYLGNSEQTQVIALKPGIAKPDDLRGKILAVSGIGSMSEVYSRMALYFNGIDDHKDTTMKPMNQQQMVQLASLGQLDAVALWPPYTTVIRREHPEAKVVANAVDAWKKEYKTRRGAPSHGLVIRQSALDAHKPECKAFAQALYAGVQAVKNKPELIAEEIAKYEKLQPEIIVASQKEAPVVWSNGLEKEDMDNAIRVWELMYKFNYSDKPVTRDIFYDILKS
jgi:ABC-type nitrate/sulfonate/bicarbonate transport system substrate-binding protein